MYRLLSLFITTFLCSGLVLGVGIPLPVQARTPLTQYHPQGSKGFRLYLPVIVTLPKSSITAISAGVLHTCALTLGGGAKCWGDNRYGELGDGTTNERHIPVNVSELSSGVTAISAGSSHTCALTQGGGVKCWGENTHGQLGDGTTTNQLTPVNVSGLSSGVIAISTGDSYTCALTQSGGVKCWGENYSGELGDGATHDEHTPVNVSGLSSGIIALSAGLYHICALSQGGGVKCWGENVSGQLGDGTTDDEHTPVNVSGLSSGVTGISAGWRYSCALTQGGGVKCWGLNVNGELGDGTTTSQLTPVNVAGLSSGIIAITTGWVHTCALAQGGGVKCWGDNELGQLGDGTTTNRLTSVNVSGLSSGVIAISTRWGHTCALTKGGGVKCWGENPDGRLGDGTTTNRLTPVDVDWPW